MMPIPWKLIGVGLVALFIGGLLWKEHRAVKRAQAAEARVATLEASLDAERKAKEKADDASFRFQARVHQLENDALGDPFPAVSLCRKPRVRAAETQPGSDVAAIPDDTEAAEGDRDAENIGPALDTYGTQCEANMIKVEELQEYLRSLQ